LTRWLPIVVIFLWCLASLSLTVLHIEHDTIYLERILAVPGWDAWLGYDELGRSVAKRLLAGARVSFFIAVSVVSISFLIGTIIGISSAWLGSWWDRLMIMIMDLFMAFPGILLAIVLAGLLGPGISNAVIALSVVGWVGFARLARAQT